MPLDCVAMSMACCGTCCRVACLWLQMLGVDMLRHLRSTLGTLGVSWWALPKVLWTKATAPTTGPDGEQLTVLH